MRRAIVDADGVGLSRRPPFDIAFGGVGVFPPRGAPRVLWIGVGGGARGADRAAATMVARGSPRPGVALEARPFHPHLTLGALAGVARRRIAARALAARAATGTIARVARRSRRRSTRAGISSGPASHRATRASWRDSGYSLTRD